MSDTTQLKLPLLQPSQAQKHVTVNEALSVLDALVQLGVKSAVLNAAPVLPTEGDRYIVGPVPLAEWAGEARNLAVWTGGAWVFHQPNDGWIAWDEASLGVLIFTAGDWQGLSGGGPMGNTVPELGIGTSPDATNKLAFSGGNALFTSPASIDLAVNKATAGDDASLSFKTGFSARALVGLLGNDSFAVKVSPDGSSFATPLVISGATGKVATLSATANGMTLSDATDATKAAVFSVAGISTGTTRTYSLPDTSQTLAHIGAVSQTFAGPVTFSNAAATFGSATATATYEVGSGATVGGSTKTVNLGTAGQSGSTTVVNIGSDVSGAGGSVVVNSPTVTFANSVTAVAMPQATASAARLGLGGATADATNRLSVNSPGILLNNAGNSIDTTLNKAGSANDASLSFKTGFSVRALFGLLATDDLTLKVSPDGTVFFDGLLVDRATGRVTLPQGAAYGALASDPATPQDGLVWYNSTTSQIRARIGGATRAMAAKSTPFVRPVTGDFVLPTMGSGTATGTVAGVAGRTDLFPFNPRSDLVIDQVSVNVTTAVAAAQGKVVVYGSNSNSQPTTRLLDSGVLDFSTTGFKSIAVSLTLREGQTYWLGIRHNSTATISTLVANATPDLTTSDLSTQQRKVLRRTITFANAAPDPWAYVSTETANATAPAIWLRST